MNTKKILIVVVFAIIGVLILVFISGQDSEDNVSILESYTETKTYSQDTVLTDPLTVRAGESIIVENGALLTVDEDTTIDGALGCRGGSLTLIATKQLTINDTIVCESEEGGDVTIVAKGGLVMGRDALIVASGNIQIVDGDNVVRSTEELNALYVEVETIPETGLVVGPFVDEGTELPDVDIETIASSRLPTFFERFFNVANAQVNNGTTTVNLTGQPIIVSGKIVIKGPVRKGAKRVVVFDFPNTPEVTIQNFELGGPDGRAGDSDSGNCNVIGKNGEDAFRFNAFAPSLKVNNFTLTLGNGGEGGEATTGEGCDEAKAKGGKGGKPGNFRMIGSQNFEITGAFTIHPGIGGAGGGATAIGKEGDPNEKGGDANATGGKGSDNKKKLTVSGTVAGTSNVQFGDAVGGFGGFALAEGGKGGDGDECGKVGGKGGKATAKSGSGGDAKLTVSGGARRMDFANDIGGEGGLAEAYGGVGGAGGSCEEQKKGGNGGKGGNAQANEGKGGLGKSGRANDGGILGDDGGDGGVGGEGCTEGIGGAGGAGGIEDGEKGEDGRNICITITKEEDYVSLLPGEIEVIKYKDYFIPVSNLGAFSDDSGRECDGEEHYHPGPNGAINLRGMSVPDPDSNECGFGKVSSFPIQSVPDPNYVEEDDSQGRIEIRGGIFGDGEMVEVDPPSLSIPSQ